MTHKARIVEQGNGFGGVVEGAEVYARGELWRVVSCGTYIHTDAPGQGNYIVAEVEFSRGASGVDMSGVPDVRVDIVEDDGAY